MTSKTLVELFARSARDHSGKAAVNAWRRYWENRDQQGEERADG